MKKENIIIVCVILMTALGFSQNSLNDYKYVIVPNKFEFLKEADKYQLNSLSKFLFNKHGFKAYMNDDELPKDALKNRCLALKASVLEKKSMFKTKLVVQLKNCNEDIVYTTAEGESRRKEYKPAYNEAIRNAFKSFAIINYKYVENKKAFPSTEVNTETEKSNEEIEKLKEEIKALREDKKEVIKANKKPKTERPVLKPKVKDQLYAQAIDGGFQLVDKTPKVIYTIYYSGKTDVFIVKDRNAVIYKVNEVWVISEFKNNSMEAKAKALDIKF